MPLLLVGARSPHPTSFCFCYRVPPPILFIVNSYRSPEALFHSNPITCFLSATCNSTSRKKMRGIVISFIFFSVDKNLGCKKYVHGFFFRILRRSWEFLKPADLRNSAPTRYSGKVK